VQRQEKTTKRHKMAALYHWVLLVLLVLMVGKPARGVQDQPHAQPQVFNVKLSVGAMVNAAVAHHKVSVQT
jgi:hypothetical protein